MPHEGEADKSLACLEADMAYFDARISLTGRPRTLYDRAQVKAYDTLRVLFEDVLRRQRNSGRGKRPPRR